MGLPDAPGDLSSEVDVEAFRRLFPLRFYERHLIESIRPDGRPLGRARDTTIALGAVASAEGSALAKIGSTTMLAAIKMEVMTPSMDSPDQGCIAIDFHMPPICSPIVRPGRPAEIAPVVSKQLSDTISSSGMINLKELSLVSGKAAWMAYLDIYCLDADGALFDAALLSAVAAFSHLQIPAVSLNDDGKIIVVSEENGGKLEKDAVNKERMKLTLKSIPFSLTCVLHKNCILADPTAEEESIMETVVTVVLDSSSQLVSLYKPGGPVLAYTSAIQDCVALTRQRMKELQKILDEANSGMERAFNHFSCLAIAVLMEGGDSLLDAIYEEDNLEGIDDVEMLDVEEGELVEPNLHNEKGKSSGGDVDLEIQGSQSNNDGLRARKKKNRRKKSGSRPVRDINRFVLDMCRRLKERKSYMVYTAIGRLGVSALNDLVKEVDAIQACGGQMTADGSRCRNGGGILWNIIKAREPKAYKEIMKKVQEFEKQFKPRNNRRGGEPKKEGNSPGTTHSFAEGTPATFSDNSQPISQMQNEQTNTGGIERVSVRDRLRIPVSYNDDLLGEDTKGDAA
ncbi:hypothetical protein CMV_018212 [Castanea mollissima]|uniref:Ribosomal RNA-processing protein 43 n=1 Tax=Castanea mollissima TaxID=60419 RepID=A0A8J4VPF6_9ROSI|nr:hypothetical protein CMV_018212 [Castanea mollissima]